MEGKSFKSGIKKYERPTLIPKKVQTKEKTRTRSTTLRKCRNKPD